MPSTLLILVFRKTENGLNGPHGLLFMVFSYWYTILIFFCVLCQTRISVGTSVESLSLSQQ